MDDEVKSGRLLEPLEQGGSAQVEETEGLVFTVDNLPPHLPVGTLIDFYRTGAGWHFLTCICPE
jgi:hypothetical protein